MADRLKTHFAVCFRYVRNALDKCIDNMQSMPENAPSLCRFHETVVMALLMAGLTFHETSAHPRASEAKDRWVIVLHGGAGRPSRDKTPADDEATHESLKRALVKGKEILAGRGTALDAVEAAVVVLEDEPRFNAGKGAVFNRAGGHELDASIMDGATRRAGAVAAVKHQKNPIKAARLVMERSPHVLLSGDEADKFGRENGLEQVGQDYFYTERRFRDLQEALAKLGLPLLEKPAYPIPADTSSAGSSGVDIVGGTVGCVALDSHGNLAAATSTGGMTGKMAGRIGDSPIIGAGNYADNRSCAVSGTGKGEEFIRNSIAARVAWLMEERGLSIAEAVKHCLTSVLKPGDGGLIAVDREGNVFMHSTTEAMPRGVADSSGRFETAISIDR